MVEEDPRFTAFRFNIDGKNTAFVSIPGEGAWHDTLSTWPRLSWYIVAFRGERVDGVRVPSVSVMYRCGGLFLTTSPRPC